MSEPILKTKNIQLLYQRKRGLHSLDLNVETGQIYGFLGRNGAGKSTSLQILAGVLKPQSGQIIFQNESSSFVKNEWKKRVGFVPQDPVFPSRSTAKQLESIISVYYPEWSHDKFLSICKRFQLPLDQNIDELSVGMKKTFSISLAYSINPVLYVLDEPTAGLDLIARKILMDLLTEESERGKGVILSTHIVDDVYENCSHLGVIHFGKSLKEGPIEEFGENARQIEDGYLSLIKSESEVDHS